MKVKEGMKVILISCIVGVGLTVLSIGITEGHLKWKGRYGKKYADVNRHTYEGSKSYVKGMAKDLANYKYEYDNTKNEIEKEAIRRLIINRFSDFEKKDLNNVNLKMFLVEMRGY